MRAIATLLSLLLCLSAAGCYHKEANEPGSTGQAGEEGASKAAPDTEEPDTAQIPLRPQLGYNIRQGRSLFQHYCLPCHGELGQGDGFNAYNLDPKPRDLSDPEFQNQRSDQDLMAVIRSGGGAAGLSTGMPPWGRTLNNRQIANLVIYLRILARKSEEATSTQ